MSVTEAYGPKTFGRSDCVSSDSRDASPQNSGEHPHSVEEALRNYKLPEDEIRKLLARIQDAEAWLGPVAVVEAGVTA
jgi:hypothetical protein